MMTQNDLTIDDLGNLFQALKSQNVDLVEQALHHVIAISRSKGLSLLELQQSLSKHGFSRTKAFDNWLSDHYTQPTI